MKIKSDIIEGEYDLYVTSAGFEERSVGAIQLISNWMSIKESIIVLYEIDEQQLFEGNQRNLEKIQNFLIDMGNEYPLVLKSNPSSIDKFREIISNKLTKTKRILIDITSFTRLYLYTLLYTLRENEVNADLLYTEPSNYTMNFTKGLEKIIIHPLMPGIPDQSKKILMIMFLGWEIQRAASVIEEFNPDSLITIAEQSDDSYREIWNSVTIKECEKVIAQSEFLRIKSLRPDIAIYKLEELYNQYHNKYDICVLNIGPKVHCLAIAQFAFLHPDVQVLYPKPYMWKQKDGHRLSSPISIGIGNTHYFQFPIN